MAAQVERIGAGQALPRAEADGRRLPGTGMLLALLAAVTAAFAFVWTIGLDLAVRPPLPARIQADDVTGLVALMGDLVARTASLLALGALAAVVAYLPLGSGETVAPDGRRLTRWAGRAGQVWFAAAVLNTFANPAYVNGVPVGLTLSANSWWTFLWASPSALAWLFSAAAALLTVVTAYAARSWAPWLLALAAGLGSWTFVAVTGNVTVGLNHDWATDAAIATSLVMGPLAAGAAGVLLRSGIGTVGGGDVRDAVARYHRFVPFAVIIAAAGHLVVAWQLLAGQPVTSQFYGLPTIGFYACLALLALSWAVRQATHEARLTPHRAVWSVVRDLAVLVLYAGFLTAAAHIPPPRFLEPQSIQVNYLGYEVPVPPTLERLLSLGRPNLLWVAIVVAALLAYAWAMVRAHRNGVHWPVWRPLSWAAGWLLTLFLAVTGLWEYSTVSYTWHMVVHMTVNMLVPVLCVLGAPLTLARAASRARAGQVTVGAAADAVDGHRPLQRLVGPPVIWLLYVGGLFAVYYTPLFGWLMRYHWAHQLMLIFFMVTGYAFFNLIIGIDRSSGNLPHLIKLALVLSVMPFHAIFAVGILSSRTLLGADFYQTLAMPWNTDLMADQSNAGQATWILGEVPLFIVIAVLAAQWFTADSREARHIDERVDSGEDDSLDAYNDLLAELAQHDRAPLRAPERPGGRRP